MRCDQLKAIFKQHILLTLALFGIVGCIDEKDHLLVQAESVLPGKWNIHTVTLPADGMGISYQGQTFYSDTTLSNVGTLEINPFSSDSLEQRHSRLDCELIIDGETIPISMTTLFISGTELWTSFSYNGPSGIVPIDTPTKQFYWSSHIFNNINYIVTIIDDDNLRIVKNNDPENHVILLSRF